MYRIYKAYQHADKIVVEHHIAGREPEMIEVPRVHYDDIREPLEVTLEQVMETFRERGQKLITVLFHNGNHVATFVTYEEEEEDEITDM